MGTKPVIKPLQWMMSGGHPNFFTVSRAPLQKKMVLKSLSSYQWSCSSVKTNLRLKKFHLANQAATL